MATRRALILNFDVEYELESPRSYSPSAKVRQQTAQLAQRFAPFLNASDVLVTAGTPRAALNNFQGVAWCPSPRALTALQAAGAKLPTAPLLNILQEVNDRRFAAEIQSDPLGARYITTLEQALEALQPPFPAHGFLAKRAFGFAGRGQRALLGPGSLEAEDLNWLRSSLRRGPGVLIEPRVIRTLDCALHGLLHGNGHLELGVPLIQHCDARGMWLRTDPASPTAAPLTPEEARALHGTAERVARALHHRGYFGPFGIDAFRYTDDHGTERFRPLVELNARLTMGYVHSGLPWSLECIS